MHISGNSKNYRSLFMDLGLSGQIVINFFEKNKIKNYQSLG